MTPRTPTYTVRNQVLQPKASLLDLYSLAKTESRHVLIGTSVLHFRPALFHCSLTLLLPGALETITAAHMQSRMAEQRTNASTSDPGNTVKQSVAVRKATEDKLSSTKKEFDRKQQRNMQKLDKLSKELDKFSLSSLNEKVRTREDRICLSHVHLCW